MPSTDWLFVRDAECMWVRRSASVPFELVIHGPGRLRRVGSFASERELRDFMRELRRRLVRMGWMLESSGAHRGSSVLEVTVH